MTTPRPQSRRPPAGCDLPSEARAVVRAALAIRPKEKRGWSVQACQSGAADGLRHQGLERLRGRDRRRRRRAGRPAVRRRLRQQRVVLVVRGAPRPCRSALVLFVVPLVTGILVLIPGQSTTALG